MMIIFLFLLVLGLSMKAPTLYGQTPTVTTPLARAKRQPSYSLRVPRIALESLLGVVGGIGLWVATTYWGWGM